MVFIFSKKFVSILRYPIVCFFFPFLSLFQMQRAKKMNFYKLVFLLKETGNQSQTFFAFHKRPHKKELSAMEKIKLAFSVSFKITYFQKSLACIGCLGLFSKIKKKYGANLYCKFSAYQKFSLLNTLSNTQWVKTFQLKSKSSQFKPHLALSCDFYNCQLWAIPKQTA